MPDAAASQTAASHEAFIADLVAGLHPVRPLAPPLARAAGWLAVVSACAMALATVADFSDIYDRLMMVPDMWLAVVGSTLTACLAAVAAFQLNLPDRSRYWALLPLPGVALWIGASGMGCLRAWLIPDLHDASVMDAMHCLAFIVCLSVPLSLLIVLMLRRGFSLSPSLTGTCAGLAVAAASASLLNFFHPFDAAATDLALHAVAVAMVVGVNRYVAGRQL